MAATVYLDCDNGAFTVRVARGASPTSKPREFKDYRDAYMFALGKMGRTGCIIDTTKMTAAQLEALREREERARALMADLETQHHG